ncbi:heavy metal translocating P-type ATPase [Campylobacter gastrosuis]|uniref:P-type Zn(2+) transporter n=1 Tax=Campylobacter gastrosuis TaxID=2974576 RepID=A0ABT7HNF6_9BACT|nr:heavy metal translocating P-type ATPase [Campylobacter gastrosuis]MDL0088190.1 heavy metal translocating P-type ATPase [Campylobacter gastrosuis]
MKHKNSVKILHQTPNRVRFGVAEISDLSDISHIEASISEFSGVNSVRVNKSAKSIIITHDTNADKIVKFIENLELKTKPKTHGISKAEIYKSALTLVASPLVSNQKAKMALSLYAGFNLLKDGVLELKNDGLTSKVLEAMAVGVSIARSDFTAANSTNLMLSLGEYMEESAVHRSDDLIKELAKPNIEEVWVEINQNGEKILNRVKTATLKKGDIVVVGAGENIGVDGYIVEGEASVNQVSMTGEAEPVIKQRGDRVISGTIVEEGRIKIWSENVGADTATARIKEYIQSSLNEKSSIGLKATKLADSLVPVTLSLAGVSYVINKNMDSVASVLQADYSCALKLATPVAFKSSISKAGRNGILIKGAKAIEALNNADTFVFDKTGTLTKGQLSVVEIYSFKDDMSQNDLLNLTASAEEHYFHPVAEAIVDAARKRGFDHIHHDEVEFIVAHGVKTSMNGKEVVIGSRHFLEDDEMIDFSLHEQTISKALNSGLTLLYIGYDRELVGVIAMKDEMRENAKDMLNRLRNLGVKELVMLSGDIKEKAEQVAAELGIDKVFANCLPTDKSRIIEELKANGANVAFVGDGINDAPSLTKANVGISMHKGADIAKATADISLLKDDIMSVAVAKEMAVKTMKLIDTNFKATVGINSAILGAATLGFLNPIATAVLHNGTTIWLLLNSMKGIKIEK